MTEHGTSVGLKSHYAFDNAWQDARQRLSLLEGKRDPGTIRHLEAIGIEPGWRCLEVGGGGGSITGWLCDRVGPTGHVVATDVDTRFLDALDAPNLEVRKHDIIVDDLEEASFDLVHVRAVLFHLAERHRALDKIIAAVKPGGWLLAEESDFITMAAVSADERANALFNRYFQHGVPSSVAGDRFYGRRLFGDVAARGMINLSAEGRAGFAEGGTPAAAFWRLSLTQFRRNPAAAGPLTEPELDELLALFDTPGFNFMDSMIVAVRGQKPAA